MRHAKAAWPDPEQSDHQRPLNERGRKAANAVGAALQARGYGPQLIWASDAARTRETAEHIIRIIPGAQTIQRSSEFYHANAQTALDAADKFGEPENVERLMWLGHNPGWSELYGYFTGRAEAFPTGGCAVLQRIAGSEDWLAPQSWRAVDFIRPKDLM